MSVWKSPTLTVGLLLLAALGAVSCSGDDACEGSCGNGIQECSEQCDDGNTRDRDGCSAQCVLEQGCLDVDGDDHTAASCGGDDCDDNNRFVNPDAVEVCANQIDDDCNAATPDIFDGDGDGDTCDLDCNDEVATIGPSLPEICDNFADDDCDPNTTDIFDADGDAFTCDVDCDEERREVNPFGVESCTNGLDDDCNGQRDCEDPVCADIPSCRLREGGVSGGPHSGSIRVTVIDRATELPMVDVRVVVKQDMRAVLESTTSTSGQARVEGLAPGPYNLTVLGDTISRFSLVGTNAAQAVLPVDVLDPVKVSQEVTLVGLDASLIGREGSFFASGPIHSSFAIVDDGTGAPAVDMDLSTPTLDPLSVELAEGAPAMVGVRIDGPERKRYVGALVIKAAPEPGLALELVPERVREIHGVARVDAQSVLSPLFASVVTVRPVMSTSAFGDVRVGEIERLIPDDELSATFSVDLDNTLEVSPIPGFSDYAYAAVIERDAGFERLRSEQRFRGSVQSLSSTTTFEMFAEPTHALYIDDTDARNPSISWNPEQSPGLGSGFHRVEIRSETGQLLWTLMIDGASDGVRIPTASGLAFGSVYTVSVSAYYLASFDFDDFRFSQIDRGWTRSTSRMVEYRTP